MSGPTQICPDCGLVHNGEHVFCPFFKGQVVPHAYTPLSPRPQQTNQGKRQDPCDRRRTQDQRQRRPKEWEYAK